jgi:phosphocarrier protein HPr
MSARVERAGVMTKDFWVRGKLGFHARPAAQFVKTASRFAKCEIVVHKDGDKADGKSLIGLLLLAAGPGTKLTVHAHGEGASQALAELELLMQRQFGEE